MKLWKSLLLPVVAAPLSAQGVLVVDAALGPGADFASLAPAVIAASEGDVILVRAGAYPEVLSIQGKSLVVQAAVSGGVRPLLQGIEIVGLGGTQNVAVRGLALDDSGPGTYLEHGLDLRDNLGPVWIEDVEVSVPTTVLITQAEAIRVTDCSSVVLSGLKLEAAMGTTTSSAGLRVTDSRVDVFGSRLEPSGIFFGVDVNPPAVLVEGASVVGLSDVTASGAPGTLIFDSHGSCQSTPGGPAVRLVGSPELVVQAGSLSGGVDPCTGDSTPLQLDAGTLLEASAPPRAHQATSPVRDDEAILVKVEGQPGDLFVALFSTSPRLPFDALAFDVPLLIELPLGQTSLGVLPDSGEAIFGVPIGELGPDVEARVVYTQAFTITPGVGQASLTEPSAITLLDAAF